MFLIIITQYKKKSFQKQKKSFQKENIYSYICVLIICTKYFIMTEFEKKIKSKFAENGIETVLQFCEKIGITDVAMRGIFKREDCKVSLLKKMCEVLSCTPNDLIV